MCQYQTGLNGREAQQLGGVILAPAPGVVNAVNGRCPAQGRLQERVVNAGQETIGVVQGEEVLVAGGLRHDTELSVEAEGGARSVRRDCRDAGQQEQQHVWDVRRPEDCGKESEVTSVRRQSAI